MTDGSNTSFRAYSIDTTNIASPTIHVTDASGAIRNANLIDVTGTTTLSNDTLFNGATVQVDVTDRLKLDHTGVFGGTITDNGTIEIVGRAAINNASLTIDNTTGQVTVDASSLLKMGGDTVTGGTINNAAGGSEEITSSSTITGTTINNGGVTIDAGQTLTLSGATIHNATINDGTVPNTGGATGGTIHVTGDTTIDSGAQLNNGNVTVEDNAALTLDNVTLSGTTVDVLAGGKLALFDTITNDGVINIDTLSQIGADLVINGTVTLGGTGTVVLENSADEITGAFGGGILNNYNTISGQGKIGISDYALTLNNELGGTIDATGGTLTLDTGNTITNSGLLEAAAGGTLIIVDNVTGTVGSAAISGGTLELGGSDAQNVAFSGAGTLKLDLPGDFTGHITGLVVGDVIDLTPTIVTTAIWDGTTLTLNGTATTFSISGLPSGDTFFFATDNHTGTDLTVEAVPTITGAVAGQTTTSEAPVTPFSTVTFTDTNNGGTHTDTLTITLAGGGTLSGTGLINDGGGVYTLSGTAAAITSELDALVFTPVDGVPNTLVTTTFTLSDQSSAYAPPPATTRRR